jgi:hypothetical protein
VSLMKSKTWMSISMTQAGTTDFSLVIKTALRLLE